MKSDEARDLISGIGDSFISEAMPERFRRHRTRRGWIAVAACFAVIVGIIGGVLYAAALRLPDIEGRLEQKKTVFFDNHRHHRHIRRDSSRDSF